MYLNSSSSAQSRIGQVSSSNNVATSSSTFLSSIRSNASLSASSSSLSSSSSSSLNISTNDGSLDQPSQRKKSIHEDIRERLEKIFKDHYDHQHSSSSSSSCSSSSNNSSTIDRKLLLSSDRIISHFPDLGDQYASLFKEILRSMATLQNGQWIRRL